MFEDVDTAVDIPDLLGVLGVLDMLVLDILGMLNMLDELAMLDTRDLLDVLGMLDTPGVLDKISDEDVAVDAVNVSVWLVMDVAIVAEVVTAKEDVDVVLDKGMVGTE